MDSLPYVIIAVWCLCPIVAVPIAFALGSAIKSKGSPLVINSTWKSNGRAKKTKRHQQREREIIEDNELFGEAREA